MARQSVGIIMNGVTGRTGYRERLVRSLLTIREQGGLRLADGRTLWPEPLLVGRSATKLQELAARHGLERWTTSLDEALARLARAAGVRNGVVRDKLFLPGLRKLKRLVDARFFGRVLSVRGEFGYRVFEGDWQPAQRPSWNSQLAELGMRSAREGRRLDVPALEV